MICTLLVILAVLATCISAFDYKTNLGYGLQRLKAAKKGRLTTGATCDNIPELWFKDAVVDNFAPIEKQVKWAGNGQRYWANKEFWGGAGFPIFVFIGGEGQESCSRLTNRMYVYQLAQEHKALLVDVEHRFYGQSYPTEDMSTDNLQYLSSSQALADLARIIPYIKNSLNTENSRVVTVGGSYPGNLAAWFRLKYPSVSHGSIASSAPVTAKVNFLEYMEVVADAMKYYRGQVCYDAFESAAESVAKLASQGFGSDGMKKLEKDFVTCSTINNELDLAILMSDLMGNVQGTAQYNNEHNGVLNMTDICDVMTANPSDPYGQFVQLAGKFRASSGLECEDANYNDVISYLADPTKDPNNNGRPWIYQTCNEFGYYQTTDSTKQPFSSWKPLNLDFSRRMCFDMFNGWRSDPEVAWINNEYGNVHIEGTNIIFPSGTIDPWHALGVTNSTPALEQPSEQPLYILGTAHCNDLYAPANSDPDSLVFARTVVADTVAKWLKK